MTEFEVRNPSSQKKAVQVKGGHKVVHPGKSVSVKAAWDEGQVKKYEAAGLKIKTLGKNGAASTSEAAKGAATSAKGASS